MAEGPEPMRPDHLARKQGGSGLGDKNYMVIG